MKKILNIFLMSVLGLAVPQAPAPITPIGGSLYFLSKIIF